MPTLAEIARHLDLTASRVEKLAAEKIIPRTGTLDDIRVRYIRHLRKTAAGSSLERRRLDRARAVAQERRNAREAGAWLPAESLDRTLIALSTTVSSKVQALPRQLAPLVAAETSVHVCEKVMDDAIRAVLTDLSNEEANAAQRLAEVGGGSFTSRQRTRARAKRKGGRSS